MAKFNYSTHSISARNEIETYLDQKGVTYEVSETKSQVTDTTTFHFVVTIDLREAKDFSLARDVTGEIKYICGKSNE